MYIERPWEESFCDKCTHCFQEDMCNAYKMGMSYAYCPQIRGCDRFEDDKKSKDLLVTNADRIRTMSDEELADFIRSMVDDDCSHEVACYGCINYGTHHSDPANKGTNLYECDGCSSEGVGLDVLKWLKQPAEGDLQ